MPRLTLRQKVRRERALNSLLRDPFSSKAIDRWNQLSPTIREADSGTLRRTLHLLRHKYLGTTFWVSEAATVNRHHIEGSEGSTGSVLV
jgi:hypothetical protein